MSNTNQIMYVYVSKKSRFFLNCGKVEAFGVGRPSPLKLAFECSLDGKLLDETAAANFIPDGGKAVDGFKQTSKGDIVQELLATRALLADRDAQIDQYKAILEASGLMPAIEASPVLSEAEAAGDDVAAEVADDAVESEVAAD